MRVIASGRGAAAPAAGAGGGVAGLRRSDSAPNTIPSPSATPRLALLSGVLGSDGVRYSQIRLPVLPSSAKMSCSPVVMYITPSFTTGVPCCENPGPKPEFRRAIQAPLSVLTFDVLILASVE